MSKPAPARRRRSLADLPPTRDKADRVKGGWTLTDVDLQNSMNKSSLIEQTASNIFKSQSGSTTTIATNLK